jgi:hypothetical protein
MVKLRRWVSGHKSQLLDRGTRIDQSGETHGSQLFQLHEGIMIMDLSSLWPLRQSPSVAVEGMRGPSR